MEPRRAHPDAEPAIAAQISMRDRNVASGAPTGVRRRATRSSRISDHERRCLTRASTPIRRPTVPARRAVENFTQGAAATRRASARLARSPTRIASSSRTRGTAALGYTVGDRGWKTRGTLARSQSRRQTLSAQRRPRVFRHCQRDLSGLDASRRRISRSDDSAHRRPCARTTVPASAIDITDGRLYSLNSARPRRSRS